MKYTYIHSAIDEHLICCETHEKVYVDYPTSLEIANIPNIVKDREKEAIERYEKMRKEVREWQERESECSEPRGR